jgi:hypothetical protein
VAVITHHLVVPGGDVGKFVEVTPEGICLRKRDLDPQVRMAHYHEERYA